MYTPVNPSFMYKSNVFVMYKKKNHITVTQWYSEARTLEHHKQDHDGPGHIHG